MDENLQAIQELRAILVKGIYDGSIDPLNLSDDLYESTVAYLKEGIAKGFDSNKTGFGEPDYELFTELQDNIYFFSAAKTFQQTLEMSEQLVDDKGELRSLKAFKEAAEQIYVKYNGGQLGDDVQPGWIESEYRTAVIQAGNAKKWQQVEKRKEILPYLQRVAVQDEKECDICSELDGITAPVDAPIWNSIAGAAHFNCRCIEIQLDKEEGEDKEWSEDEMKEAVTKSDMPDEFKFNPGKAKEIFSTEGKSTHPYFIVPKEYRKFAENNFDLDIP